MAESVELRQRLARGETVGCDQLMWEFLNSPFQAGPACLGQLDNRWVRTTSTPWAPRSLQRAPGRFIQWELHQVFRGGLVTPPR